MLFEFSPVLRNYLQSYRPGEQFLTNREQADQIAREGGAEITLCTIMYLGDPCKEDVYETVYKVKFLKEGDDVEYAWAGRLRKIYTRLGNDVCIMVTAGPRTSPTLLHGAVGNIRPLVGSCKVLSKQCVVFDHELRLPYYAYVFRVTDKGSVWETQYDDK